MKVRCEKCYKLMTVKIEEKEGYNHSAQCDKCGNTVLIQLIPSDFK